MIEQIKETYSWGDEYVHGLDELFEDIKEAETKDPGYKMGEITWYKILKAHIKGKNSKISDNTLIYSLSPATDCPHLNGEQCQVPKDSCYAYKAEKLYTHSADNPGGPLHRKRRLTVIWDLLDADTFADLVIEIVNRGSKEIEYLRLNEAGDIRNEHDLHKVNHIAKRLSDEVNVQVYLYSATYKNPQTGEPFPWPTKEDRNFTLMASNDFVEPHADTRFKAKMKEDVEDTDVVCPAELQGRDQIKCGECRLCPEGLVDEVVVPLH